MKVYIKDPLKFLEIVVSPGISKVLFLTSNLNSYLIWQRRMAKKTVSISYNAKWYFNCYFQSDLLELLLPSCNVMTASRRK